MGKIAARIRTARKAAGLSQAELASLIGIYPGTVSAWETDQQEPQRHIQKLAEVLKVPVDWLLSGEDVVAVKHLRTKADVREALAVVTGEEFSPRVQDLNQDMRQAIEAMQALPVPYRKRAVEVLKMMRTLKADDLKMVLEVIRRLSGKKAR